MNANAPPKKVQKVMTKPIVNKFFNIKFDRIYFLDYSIQKPVSKFGYTSKAI